MRRKQNIPRNGDIFWEDRTREYLSKRISGSKPDISDPTKKTKSVSIKKINPVVYGKGLCFSLSIPPNAKVSGFP